MELLDNTEMPQESCAHLESNPQPSTSPSEKELNVLKMGCPEGELGHLFCPERTDYEGTLLPQMHLHGRTHSIGL